MYVSTRPLVEIQNLQEIFASTHLLCNLVYVHILYILLFLWWLVFPCFCDHFYITKTIICKNCNLCVDLERRGVQVLSNPPPPPHPEKKLKLCLRPPIPQANLYFTWNPPSFPRKNFWFPIQNMLRNKSNYILSGSFTYKNMNMTKMNQFNLANELAIYN